MFGKIAHGFILCALLLSIQLKSMVEWINTFLYYILLNELMHGKNNWKKK